MLRKMESNLQLRHFSKDLGPGETLKETTVHGWKVKYLSESKKRKREEDKLVVKTLPVAKRGGHFFWVKIWM